MNRSMSWKSFGDLHYLELDSDFYLELHFMEDNSVHYKIAVQDKSGGRTLYYQDLSSTREGFYFKEAEDLAKRYFKSITNKL